MAQNLRAADTELTEGERTRSGAGMDMDAASQHENYQLRITNGTASQEAARVSELDSSLVRKKRGAQDVEGDGGDGDGNDLRSKRARHLVAPSHGVGDADQAGMGGEIATRDCEGGLLQHWDSRVGECKTKQQISDLVTQEAKYHKDDLATRRQNLRLLLDNWTRVMETEAATEMRDEVMLSLFGALVPADFPSRETVEREKALVDSMLDGVTEASQGAEGGLGHWDDAATLPAKLLLRPLQQEVEMLRLSVCNREAELAETQRVLAWMDPMPSAIATLCEEACAGADTALALNQGMPRWMTVRGTLALGSSKGGKSLRADHDEMKLIAETRGRRLVREQERLRLKEEELEALRAAREDEEVSCANLFCCVRYATARDLYVSCTRPTLSLHPSFLLFHFSSLAAEPSAATRARDSGHQ